MYLNALHHKADVVGFPILIEIYNNNNKAITGVLPPTPKFTISFLEEQPPPVWRNLVFIISICHIVITIMMTVWFHVTAVWGRLPVGINGACNAVHYEAGPLTTVSSPILIIAAQTKNERLMSAGV